MTQNRLVIGLGESGMALVRHAMRTATPVTVYDSRQAPAQLPALKEKYPDVTAHCGAFDTAYLDGVSEVVLSPGLSPHAEPLKTILALANERAIPVFGELAVFTRALDDLKHSQNYSPKVLAVTGTNGKTTVTSLTRHLCHSVGVRALAAGNISPSMLDALCDALDNEALPDVWVLELSSFQLQFAQGFNPNAATVLNISQDHLDWHADMAEYAQAKAHVFGADTVQVLNRDDAAVMAMAKPSSIQMNFGIHAPTVSGDYGLWREGGMDWLSVALADDVIVEKKKRGQAVTPVEITLQRLMPADALQIRGRHNAMNALAALALCRAIDLPLAKLLHGLRDYAGEPHRVQWIANINGVDFYDDSKGTNVGASLAAIEGLGQKIVLVAGGDGKGQDFAPMVDAIKVHVVRVCLIGKDAGLIEKAWQGCGVPIQVFDDLEAATLAAAQAAQAGQAVLLSPACASLDMFKNYAHRAQVFVDVVRAWANDMGQV
ncbi:MAG: UDP-N-acetylmuramoyl-L-alanine--D-glutamate ligase [Burkholderiales bacterium]|nr:UDP-N-acetylmuramoyl-L-alanine--D-glutamate ligase [Burkholderiales bacterium]